MRSTPNIILNNCELISKEFGRQVTTWHKGSGYKQKSFLLKLYQTEPAETTIEDKYPSDFISAKQWSIVPLKFKMGGFMGPDDIGNKPDDYFREHIVGDI